MCVALRVIKIKKMVGTRHENELTLISKFVLIQLNYMLPIMIFFKCVPVRPAINETNRNREVRIQKFIWGSQWVIWQLVSILMFSSYILVKVEPYRTLFFYSLLAAPIDQYVLQVSFHFGTGGPEFGIEGCFEFHVELGWGFVFSFTFNINAVGWT